jgi:excisionase family DNA binding protein
MQIGETEVLTLKQAAARIGLSASTLRNQIKNGALRGQVIGNTYVVTARDLAAYDERRKQPRGFSNPAHPMHGKQGPGHRRKGDASPSEG